MMDPLEQAKAFALRVGSWTELQRESYGVARRPERVPEVNELRQRLKSLGVKELDYFSEGLDCVQYAQAPRAAIVLGWTGFVDLVQAKMERDKFAALNAILKLEFHGIYKRYGQIKSRTDLSDGFDDSMLLQAGKKLDWYKKHVYVQLDAMRDERNNCAHVQEYAITPRTALGFYDKLVTYIPNVL
jgi:hypothetical protein